MAQLSWTKKSNLERISRFEANLAAARASGDTNAISNWEEAIQHIKEMMADNKKRAAPLHIGRDMKDAARKARSLAGVREYSPEEDAKILAAGTDKNKLAEIAPKLQRTIGAMRTRYRRLTGVWQKR